MLEVEGGVESGVVNCVVKEDQILVVQVSEVCGEHCGAHPTPRSSDCGRPDQVGQGWSEDCGECQILVLVHL